MDSTAILAGLTANATDGSAGNATLASVLHHYSVVAQNLTATVAAAAASATNHSDISLLNPNASVYSAASSSSEEDSFAFGGSAVATTAAATVTAIAALVSSNLSAIAASNGQSHNTTNPFHSSSHDLQFGAVPDNITSTLRSTLLATVAAVVSSSSSSEEETAAVAATVSSTTITSLASSSSSLSNDGEDSPLSALSKIIIFIVCLAVILGTVIGNILVCVAVCLVKKLRRPCNYLLVSLALSDLCVAVLVMPVALLNELGDVWPFGTLFCDIWVSFDVLSCTASILNLCAISVDRYWAITKPLEYGVKRTPRRMLMCVGLVWLGAACISLPPLLILGNEHVTEDGQPMCNVCQNFGYQIYATFCAFYLPLIIMLFVYYQIFRAARRIVLDEKRAQTRLDQAMLINGHTQHQQAKEQLKVPGGHNNGSSTGSTALIGATGSPHHHQRRLRFQLAKERKASTTLGIIMSSFTLCWLPFFILAIVRPFLDPEHMVPDFLSSIFLWLGYANSLLNPIIYATLNRDFRKPFQEILFFRCSNLNTIMREEYYHSQYGEPASQRVVVGSGEGHGARESFL